MELIIYTDGACRGNGTPQNIGAYAYRLIYGPHTKDFSQATIDTTNNRMELTAAIEALKAVKNRTIPTTLFSDSMYVIKGVNEWSPNWIRKRWKDVRNSDLWKELLQVTETFTNIEFHHVKGHAGIPNQEAVDYLCNKAMDYYVRH